MSCYSPTLLCPISAYALLVTYLIVTIMYVLSLPDQSTAPTPNSIAITPLTYPTSKVFQEH